jgi:hypothetical protein
MGILNDCISQKGFVSVSVLSDGEIISNWKSKNLIVNTGLSIFPLILQNKTAPTTSIKYGTNSTAASVSQTNLISFFAEDLSATVSAVSNAFTTVSVMSATQSVVLKEFGLFVNNLMYSRVVNVSGISLSTNQTIITTWTITLNRA